MLLIKSVAGQVFSKPFAFRLIRRICDMCTAVWPPYVRSLPPLYHRLLSVSSLHFVRHLAYPNTLHTWNAQHSFYFHLNKTITSNLHHNEHTGPSQCCICLMLVTKFCLLPVCASVHVLRSAALFTVIDRQFLPSALSEIANDCFISRHESIEHIGAETIT